MAWQNISRYPTLSRLFKCISYTQCTGRQLLVEGRRETRRFRGIPARMEAKVARVPHGCRSEDTFYCYCPASSGNLLCEQWQERMLSATFLESHSHSSVKQAVGRRPPLYLTAALLVGDEALRAAEPTACADRNSQYVPMLTAAAA